jgi:hypothetical protein
MSRDTVEALQNEIVRYVAEYNRTFGWMKMRILAALFGKRIQKITGMSVRDFVDKTQLFWAAPTKNGGTNLWERGTPIPEGTVM